MPPFPEPFASFHAGTQATTELRTFADAGPDAWHAWSDAERLAVIHAWACRRPLLIRGEAGVGKSQLARAVAQVLKVSLFKAVIHPRFEATDLLYREDLVRRLATAQLAGALRPAGGGTDAMAGQIKAQIDELLKAEDFVSPGVLAQAYQQEPATGAHSDAPRAVVLIDEIDKADADVPNALLDVLGAREIALPGQPHVLRCEQNHPLVLITTNEDRELPPAFVRRCAVLNLRPDDANESDFVGWLVKRAQAHRALASFWTAGPVEQADPAPGILHKAAVQVWKDRKDASGQSLPTVGLAEYLDLLYSLHKLAGGDPERASDLLDQIAPYALVKQRDQDQTRTVVAQSKAREA